MLFYIFFLFALLLPNYVTCCSSTKPSGSRANSHIPSTNANLPVKTDLKLQRTDGIDSYIWWRRLVFDYLSLGDLQEIFVKFKSSMPTVNQALLTTVFSWAQQRIVSPTGRAVASHLATLLPPPPPKCPVVPRPPISNTVPTEEEVFEILLSRQNFTPDESGASLLLTAFAQHVILQFASEDNASLVFDASQIYGSDTGRQLALRTGRRGMLKMTNCFPPNLTEAHVDMMYPPSEQRILRFFYLTGLPNSKATKWALGHPLLGASPLTFSVSVLWIREHNRLCGQLISRHPTWSDQRLFDAARAIVTGKMILITLNEVLPRLAGTDVLTFEKAFSEEPIEEHAQVTPMTNDLATGLLWTWQLPDELTLGGAEYRLSDILFTDHHPVMEHGLAAIFDSLSSQTAGKTAPHNHVRALKGWTKRVIRQLRRVKTVSFNGYRKMAGLPVINSFQQLTGDKNTAGRLKELYGSEDSLELYTGLVLEKTEGRAVLPPTLLHLLASSLHAAISSSPIGSPSAWEENGDIFGDAEGFKEVQSASISNLLRDNGCGRRKVSLNVPHIGDAVLPASSPGCAFSLRPQQLSASLVCSLMRNHDVGFSLRVNMFIVS